MSKNAASMFPKKEPDQEIRVPPNTEYRVIVETMAGERLVFKENLTAGAFILMGRMPESWQTGFGRPVDIGFAIAKSPYTFREIATKIGINDIVDKARDYLRAINQPHRL